MRFATKTLRPTKASKSSCSFFPGRDTKPLFFQRKLTVGPANDVYEREADAVADKVMRMNNDEDEKVQPKVSTVDLQRKCAACEEEEQAQRKEKAESNSGGYHAPPIVDKAIQSGGKSLDGGTRSFMESRMGYDFSHVKIHTGTLAAKSAQAINALAFTSGNSIVFNEGQYSPQTDHGKRLLAHELTHVIQQKSGRKIQRSVKNLPCTVHAYDDSNPLDTAVIPEDNKDKSVVGVGSVSDMVTKVNSYIDSKDNNCKCVSKLEINGHGTDGYQSVGNGNLYKNDEKALVHDSKQEHLEKLKGIKFCNTGMLLLMGCHVGQGLGTVLLEKISKILPGVIIGGAQHYTFGKGKGNKKVVGEGDEVTKKSKVKDPDKASSFLTSPYVTWYLTINGNQYIIEGKDTKSTESQSKLKTAEKVKVVTPEGEVIKIK